MLSPSFVLTVLITVVISLRRTGTVVWKSISATYFSVIKVAIASWLSTPSMACICSAPTCGLSYVPARGCFFFLLRGWQRAVPSVSHPPLTWPITIAIARTMASNGFQVCAVATLVAFDGLLRVGELVNIAVADISLPGDSRRGTSSVTASTPRVRPDAHPSLRQPSSALVRLAVTKTGRNQTAELVNPEVIALLRRYLRDLPGDSRLFPISAASPADHFRSVFRAACIALDLGGFGFTPHSLRHGGATHAHMHLGQTIEHVLHRGRWQSNSSARIYIQSGAAALIATRLSDRARTWVHQLQSAWVDHLWADCFGRPARDCH